MSLIDRYNLKQLTIALLTSLGVLTTLIWLTQALRDFDLMTKQGQALRNFLFGTSLALPSLIVIVAPIAFFISVVWTLNRLNGDSELVVMTGGGVSPARLSRPFVIMALLVAGAVGVLAIHIQPTTARLLRNWLIQAGADTLAKIAEGRFVTKGGVTLHVRERQPNGVMLGLFIQAPVDNQIYTYVAEQGQIVKADNTLYLIMEKGFAQHQQEGTADPVIVSFESYAFDLSKTMGEPEVTVLKPRERSLSELLYPNPTDPQYKASPGKFRAELVDRLTAPLYPVVFMFVALAALGQARTTRQGRGVAIAGAIGAVLLIRVSGFAAQILSARSPAGVILAFAIPLLASLVSIVILAGWIKPHVPQWLTRWGSDLQARMSRMAGA